MAVTTAAAVITAGVLAAGSSVYAAQEQKKAAKADQARREAEAAASKAEADRIARETKPEEESLADTKFGTDGEGSTGGSSQDFLIPRKNSALGTSGTGRSGLGFKV